MTFDGWHEGTFEPVPDDLPEPMKRIRCSCGWQAIALTTRDCDEKLLAHLDGLEP